MHWLVVFLGGGLGAVLRYGLLRACEPLVRGFAFPWTIFIINVSGSFLLGCVLGLATPHAPHSNWKLFLGTGVLGGYTTFSTFSTDTLALIEAQRPGLAFANAAGSVVAGLAFAALGWWLVLKLKS